MRGPMICLLIAAIALPVLAQKEDAVAKRPPISPVVEAESEVYAYAPFDNGSAPMWCFGSTCLARIGDRLFASGIEAVPDAKPLNNVRWTLYEMLDGQWMLRQVDPKDRTREPCPLGAHLGGPLLMSVNPTLVEDPQHEGGGPARPEILAFNPADLGAPFETLLPQWEGEPTFTEHSYRTFAADGPGRGFILMQNVGYTHSEWAFRDGAGEWHTGKLNWPERPDPEYAPYRSTHERCNYPDVFLRGKQMHFVGASAHDQWDRVRTDRTKMGRQWGNRWRRLLYNWSPDITTGEFGGWVEIANTFATGGWLFPGDMWVDDTGAAHICWSEHPINWKLGAEFFPDIKRTYALKYAVVRDGEVIHRRTLVETGQDISPEVVGTRGQPRLQITADDRVFACYYVWGKDADSEKLSENRVIELYADGTQSDPVKLDLRRPLREFFTATPRGGSPQSNVLEMFGTPDDDPNAMAYARVKLY